MNVHLCAPLLAALSLSPLALADTPAQRYQDLLESGMRMARVNPEGEREYLSDDERDKRMERIRGDLAQRCAAS